MQRVWACRSTCRYTFSRKCVIVMCTVVIGAGLGVRSRNSARRDCCLDQSESRTDQENVLFNLPQYIAGTLPGVRLSAMAARDVMPDANSYTNSM